MAKVTNPLGAIGLASLAWLLPGDKARSITYASAWDEYEQYLRGQEELRRQRAASSRPPQPVAHPAKMQPPHSLHQSPEEMEKEVMTLRIGKQAVHVDDLMAAIRGEYVSGIEVLHDRGLVRIGDEYFSKSQLEQSAAEHIKNVLAMCNRYIEGLPNQKEECRHSAIREKSSR